MGSKFQFYGWISEVQWFAESHTVTKWLHSLSFSSLFETDIPMSRTAIVPLPSRPLHNINYSALKWPLFIIDTHLRLTFSNSALEPMSCLLESLGLDLRIPSSAPVYDCNAFTDGVMRWTVVAGPVWIVTTCYIQRVTKNVPSLAPNHHYSKKNSFYEWKPWGLLYQNF